jgi:hypothetical protein
MKVCEHINFNNERDCENEADFICICCGVPICSEHKEKDCPYGGSKYIEIKSITNS